MILFASIWGSAQAAELDGVPLPATVTADGKTLHLNGYGLRKYSVLGIHIYAAALYLEHLSTNAGQIVASPETKLLTVRFERDVNVDQARDSWRVGLANNCQLPCRLDPEDVATFISHVPAMHSGDNFTLLFTRNGANVTVNGQVIGTVAKRPFAEAVLNTFLGPNPASPSLKQELLTGHD